MSKKIDSRKAFPTTMMRLNLASTSQGVAPTSVKGMSLGAYHEIVRGGKLMRAGKNLENKYCRQCNRFFATPFNLRRHKGKY